jgi:hypothetical protein
VHDVHALSLRKEFRTVYQDTLFLWEFLREFLRNFYSKEIILKVEIVGLIKHADLMVIWALGVKCSTV